MAFAPDSRTLATATPATKDSASVTLWDLASLRQKAELPARADSLVFLPDGRTLAAFHADEVTLWDIESRKLRLGFKLSRQVDSSPVDLWPIAFSADGKLLCLGDDLLVHVWDTTTGKHVAALKGHRQPVRRIAFSPDGKTLATTGGAMVKLWNVATWEEVTTLLGANGVGQLAFAPDGTLAVSYMDNSVRLWRIGKDAQH
jgi:WD40 repeat protein